MEKCIYHILAKKNSMWQFSSASGGSSGVSNSAVYLEYSTIFFKIGFNFYHYGQFRSASGGSSDTPNMTVHLEHARIFF
jgi:hypothetical protein